MVRVKFPPLPCLPKVWALWALPISVSVFRKENHIQVLKAPANSKVSEDPCIRIRYEGMISFAWSRSNRLDERLSASPMKCAMTTTETSGMHISLHNMVRIFAVLHWRCLRFERCTAIPVNNPRNFGVNKILVL